MNTYYTKCGREFSKSVKAATTGYVLSEQPGDGQAAGQIVDPECAKCPFAMDVKDGWPEQRHKRFECRAGSQPPNHKNEWQGNLTDKCTIRVLSLDHKFCEAVIAYCREQQNLCANYAGEDDDDCRKVISIGCSQNKKGVAAKQVFVEKFFPAEPVASASDFKAKCPFLKTVSEKSIQCLGFDCKILGNVDFSSACECRDWVNGKCFDRFLDCENYRKYYSDPQIIHPEDKRCISCCNNSWYMELPQGLDGQTYCFCQKDKKAMLHDDSCEWFDRHLSWPLESKEENESHFKEGADMGKMSTANIMDAMKKAKQKTGALKFAPHPEDLPLEELLPNPHNKFADQDDTASIEDIKDNILRVGLINPLAVNHKDGKYFILSGERRYNALMQIHRENPDKFSYIRCSVYDNLAFAEEMEVLYAANLKVRHYDAAQRLEYFRQLKDILTAEKGAGRYDGPIQADIAAIMGVTDRQVRKYDQINQELDDTDKQKIKDGELSVDAAARKAAEHRQERKNGATGSASGEKPDMAFWEPYIREVILFYEDRCGQILLYYQEQQRSAADGAAFLKRLFGNCGGACDYSNGKGCMYDFGGGKLQLDVLEQSADENVVKKRHREHFPWSQIEKIVRQMIVDGSLKKVPVENGGAPETPAKQANQPLPEPDLVSLALPVEDGKPVKPDASADGLYQHTYDDVLQLMEALQEKDSAGYEEVARLFGKIMHLMRQKGHKLEMGDAESAINHGKV